MNYLRTWFQANLDIVFFVYGLAFVLMGLSILFQCKEGSRFKIANHMWLLAAFGLTHGANEWLDMWAIIKGHDGTLDRIRWLCLIVSYIFIFEFGRRLFSLRNSHSTVSNNNFIQFLKNGYLLSPAVGIFIIIIGLSAQDFWKTETILIRYFLGFPGSIMAGFGFIYYFKNRKEELGFSVTALFVISYIIR